MTRSASGCGSSSTRSRKPSRSSTSLSWNSMRSIRRTEPAGRRSASVGLTPMRSGNGCTRPRRVQQRRVLGEQPHAVVTQRGHRQRALAAARGQQHADRPARPGERERVQPRQPDRVEVLADARQQEQVRGLVGEVRMLAADHDAAAGAVQLGARAPEVVEDRARAVLVDDVARRDERRGQVAIRIPARRALLQLDDDVGRRRVRDLEPEEVAQHLVGDLGPAAHVESQPVDVEHGRVALDAGC